MERARAAYLESRKPDMAAMDWQVRLGDLALIWRIYVRIWHTKRWSMRSAADGVEGA